MASKKEQEQLDQEEQDALDFSGEGYENSRGSYSDDEDEPWDGESEEAEEEQEGSEEEADDQEEEDEAETTKDDEESTEDDEEEVEADEEEEGSPTFTLDGKKYTADEIVANPELLGKMATHYNQVGNFQKIADERGTELEQLRKKVEAAEADARRVQDEWVRRKMEEDARKAKAAEQESQPAPPPRPPTDQLVAQFKPYLDGLKEQGRLTEDEVEEHSGLVAEYLYDTLQTRDLIQKVTAYFAQELDEVKGFINPAIKEWDKEQAIREDAKVQQEAAKIEGYEELADPENWENLKQYIGKKIANSKRDSEGNPLFDPIFDAETMAEQWDAMQGKILRAAVAKQKKTVTKSKKQQAKQASGSATSGGKTPKKRPKPKGAPTPEEDAMDFGSEGRDSTYAGG